MRDVSICGSICSGFLGVCLISLYCNFCVFVAVYELLLDSAYLVKKVMDGVENP